MLPDAPALVTIFPIRRCVLVFTALVHVFT
jgi:hypothetical protein